MPETVTACLSSDPTVCREGSLGSPPLVVFPMALNCRKRCDEPPTIWEENGFHLPGRSVWEPEQMNPVASGPLMEE